MKWTATTHGDVSAIPAVVDGAVYVPDWGPNFLSGYLNKFDAATGTTIWSKPISNYTGVANDAARAAPVVQGNTIYLGDQGAQPGSRRRLHRRRVPLRRQRDDRREDLGDQARQQPLRDHHVGCAPHERRALRLRRLQ